MFDKILVWVAQRLLCWFNDRQIARPGPGYVYMTDILEFD